MELMSSYLSLGYLCAFQQKEAVSRTRMRCCANPQKIVRAANFVESEGVNGTTLGHDSEMA